MEALTTKNLEIGERCGELEATIADLESSVEMSEELETQQAEDIRELQVYIPTSALKVDSILRLSAQDNNVKHAVLLLGFPTVRYVC